MARGQKMPARTKKIALFAEKLVKNGQKKAKIGGPNRPEAKKGQPEHDPGQKWPARTRPGPEKKWPDPALLNIFFLNMNITQVINWLNAMINHLQQLFTFYNRQIFFFLLTAKSDKIDNSTKNRLSTI